MKNKQRGYSKILVGFSALMLISFQSTFSQTSSFRLKTADSLFQAKRYVQSFEHYEQILQQKQFTPAMLLKMAYIQEGLLHTGRAMYYLNLYFIITNDKTALDKMKQLATKFNLQGYDTSDTDKIVSYYHDYYPYFTLSLAAIVLFMLSLTFYTRLRLKRQPIASFIMVLLFTIALTTHLYYGEHITTGIVANPSTYVMSGPSAGASVIDIVGDGHRVEILGQKDVWLRIKWDGEIAYVKQNALLPVQL
jgi:hypothetical protein